jgi:alanine racemase
MKCKTDPFFFREIPSRAFGDKPVVMIRDIEAVVHNYRLFKEKADKTGSICGVVVKADVHGLKMKDVAPALYEAGARHFFIEELIEGIELRGILPFDDARIYAMAGLLWDEEAAFYDNRITPCLNSVNQIRRWNNFSSEKGKQRAVIHLDTHMNRLGLLDDQVDMLSKNYKELTSNLTIDFYMSHFYDIKGSDHSNCFKQLGVLHQYLEKLPKAPISFACTDSVILLDNKTFNFDMIRPGIGLVGGAPNATSPVSEDACHTLEIYAKISQIKFIKKGQPVGYGGAYTTRRDTKIALVHIGYKDGYLRSLSELDHDPKGVFMMIGPYKTPVIGKISLGMTTIDVTDVPDDILKKYGYAEVVGPNVDLRELADKAGCYEILAALGRPNKKFADYTKTRFDDLFKEGLASL